MAKIKTKISCSCCQGYGTKENSPPLLGRVQTCRVTLENNMEGIFLFCFVFQNKNQSTMRPLLGIYSKIVLSYHKDICSTVFITDLFIIAGNWR